MYSVENVNTKERFVMAYGEIDDMKIVRLYSSCDDSGNSDFNLPLEEFERDYKILEKLED